jgi:hypothetical protein
MIGPTELIIVVVILFSLLVPVAAIIFLFVIYDKIRRIEQRLDRLDKDQ